MRKGTKVLLHNMYIRPFQMLVLFVMSEMWISFVSFFLCMEEEEYRKLQEKATFLKARYVCTYIFRFLAPFADT